MRASISGGAIEVDGRQCGDTIAGDLADGMQILEEFDRTAAVLRAVTIVVRECTVDRSADVGIFGRKEFPAQQGRPTAGLCRPRMRPRGTDGDRSRAPRRARSSRSIGSPPWNSILMWSVDSPSRKVKTAWPASHYSSRSHEQFRRRETPGNTCMTDCTAGSVPASRS